MEKHQTFTGSEQFFHCATQYDSPYKSLNLARFLSAGERPSVVFTHHTLSTWHYTPLPKAEMTTALAQSAAGGSNVWFAIFMDAMTTRAGEAFDAVSLCEFLERHEDYYTATRPAAETAVLLSNRTLYYYITGRRELAYDAGDGAERNLIAEAAGEATRQDLAARREASAKVLDQEYPGCLDAMNHSHVPARVLWDEHLTPAKLRGVKTLVLPNAACLSDTQLLAVQGFVGAGGGLVATFESGMYDVWGDPAARPGWLRFLGIERVEGAWKPSRTEDYVSIATDRLRGFENGVMIPRPVNGLKVRPTADAEVLAWFYNAVSKSYLGLKGVSEYPAALLTRRGKGRVVYLASPVFESFNLYHVADHRRLAQAAVDLAAGRRGLQVRTNAPGSLAIEVRAQKGRLIVHLVNVTSEMKRPMERIVPLRDVEVCVRATGVRRVRALRSGRALPFQAEQGRVKARLPVVEDYEVLVLDRSGGDVLIP
jgi:hypothetical protein